MAADSIENEAISMKYAITTALVLLSMDSALADWSKVANEWPDLTQGQKDWFIKQHNKNGFLCCSYADGHPTDWDVREGKYWAIVDGEWREIPDEYVVDVPNPVGRAVVWWAENVRDETGRKQIRCFVPGPGA